ncbi:MAG: acyltransferase [Clostridium sp.]|nr:acyltransferase [Clostridium sp.]
MKLLLILGVVLIHCNIADDYSRPYSPGVEICNFISSNVCQICVPSFFIISGFLFFRGIKTFSASIYLSKLRRRLHSLLIPYLFWCAFCCLLLYVKHACFHMPGLGIFLDNGKIDTANLLKGFICIQEAGNYPYAFAFWFIRNLMAFCAISPLIYAVSKSRLLLAALFLTYICVGIDLFGAQWFALGAALSLQKWNIDRLKPGSKGLAAIASVAFWGCACIDAVAGNAVFHSACFAIKVLSGLWLTYLLGSLIGKCHIMRKLMPATFMIYATHQCYCTIARKFYASIFGHSALIGPIAAYALTFATLVALGYITYALLHKLAPRFLAFIAGGRY